MHRGRRQRDPYAQLGVSRAATPAEINAAYRKLVRALHPDSADTPTEPSASPPTVPPLPGNTDVPQEVRTLRRSRRDPRVRNLASHSNPMLDL